MHRYSFCNNFNYFYTSPEIWMKNIFFVLKLIIIITKNRKSQGSSWTLDWICYQFLIHNFIDHPKRVCNSLQTLCALFYTLFKRHATEMTLDIINAVLDFENFEDKMKTLLTKCNNFMISDVTGDSRVMCLKLLLVNHLKNFWNIEQDLMVRFFYFFFFFFFHLGICDWLQ